MDFDWLFYISKVHLNYSKVEFMESTHAEIYKMWLSHVKFNGWENNEDEKDSENKTQKEKKVFIDEIPFL